MIDSIKIKEIINKSRKESKNESEKLTEKELKTIKESGFFKDIKNNDIITLFQMENHKDIIDIVGEPMLKMSLMELYDSSISKGSYLNYLKGLIKKEESKKGNL